MTSRDEKPLAATPRTDRVTEPGSDPALASTIMPETQSVKGDADTLPDLAAVEPISLPGRFNPDQIPPSIHERFDDLQFLGRGGMGTVYRGYDKRLTREVAIKFVHGHDALRFLREARAQAKITHDNVCKIYDVGLADGQPYITMQLVRGESLGVVCKEMTLEEKVKVIRESASALHEAHRMGLVHRDVKPGNILVERSEDGGYRPFVMDFGLARIAGEKGETMTGQIAGTPAYMAPEQARGEIRSLDRRTDVYSLGATFYDILADHPPFVDEQPWKILMRISSEDAPALSSVCPNVPIDVETIIMKCLEREQARRYESARALGEDLQRYLDGNVVLARKASVLHRWAKRARKHKLLVSLASVALIVAVVVVFLGLRARRIAGEQARIAQEMGENVKEMQLFMQYAHALPVHDIEREQAVIRKRLVDIATKMAAGGAIGRGAGEYALGRGFLALEEPENALEHLNEAETAGMVSPEFEYATGRALVEIYREKTAALRRISDEKIRATRQAELDTTYKTPALLHLRKATDSRLEHPAYVEGLIALTEERYEDALRLARQAQEEAPWFYEATVLEAEVHHHWGAKFKHDANFDYEKMKSHYVPALDAYRRASAMASSDPTVYEKMCEVLLQWVYSDDMTGKDPLAHFQEGKEAAENAIKTSPNRALSHLRRAMLYSAYYNARREEAATVGMREAVQFAKDAVRLAPDDPQAYEVLGTAQLTVATALDESSAESRDALEKAATAFEKAIELDSAFLWPAYGVSFVYRERAVLAMLRGDDPTDALKRGNAALAHAQEISPDSPDLPNPLINMHSITAQTQFQRGEDPTAALDAGGRVCDRVVAERPNDTTMKMLCSEIPNLRAEFALATHKDPQPFLAAQDKLLADAGPSTAWMNAITHVIALTTSARAALARGESPVEDLTRAITLCQDNREDGVQLMGPAVLMQLRWQSMHKKMKESSINDYLKLLEPLLTEDEIEPELFRLAAATHERHAAWLVDQHKDASDALTKGFGMVSQAFKRNPHMPGAFATRGDLYLVEARVAKDSKSRTIAAKQAKESFDSALHYNQYLAWETEAARKEVEQILNPTDSNGQ